MKSSPAGPGSCLSIVLKKMLHSQTPLEHARAAAAILVECCAQLVRRKEAPGPKQASQPSLQTAAVHYAKGIGPGAKAGREAGIGLPAGHGPVFVSQASFSGRQHSKDTSYCSRCGLALP